MATKIAILVSNIATFPYAWETSMQQTHRHIVTQTAVSATHVLKGLDGEQWNNERHVNSGAQRCDGMMQEGAFATSAYTF
jgi:hypothetical protein